MRHPSRLLLSLALLFSLLIPFAASAEDVSVTSFGKIAIVKSGTNWTADLGKLGKHTFTGTVSPLNLQKVITATDLLNMPNLPGRAVLTRLGFQQSTLALSGKGLSLSTRLDTQKNLKGLTKLLKIEAPYLDVTARIAPSGFSLRGDLSFSRKAVALTLIPGLGTKIELDKLSLCFDVGTGLPDMDEPFLKKITSISLDIAPVVSVRAECRLQPTKWDPLLNTVSEFSYNLITQEMVVSASMMSRWVNPLGLSLLFKDKEAIVFENAAVAIGWIPGSPVPTKVGYGIENAKIFGLKFGSVVDVAPADGKLAMKYHCEKLSFNDLAALIAKGFGKKMPELIPGDLALRNIDILFSPNGGKVGELEIEQGFRFKGEANIGTALKGTIDFYANFDDGLGLTIELKNSMRALILEKLKNKPILRKIIARITSTLDVRRIAISLVAKRSEFGGGIACDMTLFGRNLSFNVSGSFNPEQLAKTVVNKIVDFCKNEVAEAFRVVGRSLVNAAEKAKQWAIKAGATVKQIANNLRTRIVHSRHSYDKCMNECTPNYANDQSNKLLDGSNDAVNEFFRTALPEIASVEGETDQETRQLRDSIMSEQWKAVCASIDQQWADIADDTDVRRFFTKKKSKDDGVTKYRGLIEGNWNLHKAARATVYEQLLTMSASLDMTVTVYEKGIGMKQFGAGEYAGTKGESRPVQDISVAFKTKIPNLGLRYRAHVSNVGDTAYVNEGNLFGYAGKQNFEGISIELTGSEAALYDVYYSGHIANVGDSKTFKNGEFCGTRGKGQALEGLSVWVVKKALSIDLAGSVYVRSVGNMGFVSRQFAGTKGRGLPVQDFSVAFKTANPNLGIRYKAHVSNVGDTAYVDGGRAFGYAGRQNLEGISLELTGSLASQYNICYSAHIANVGDSATFKNGEFCGTRGKGQALEGITVWVEKK